MYGTIFRLRPQAGRERDVVALTEEWARTRGQQVQGARAVYVLQSEQHPGELLCVAVFDDQETFKANAAAPEQDAWYRRLREVLAADPEWEDGTYLVATHVSGGGGG